VASRSRSTGELLLALKYSYDVAGTSGKDQAPQTDKGFNSSERGGHEAIRPY